MGVSSLSLVLASVVAVVAEPPLPVTGGLGQLFVTGKTTASSFEGEPVTKSSEIPPPTPSSGLFKSNWTIPPIAIDESTTLSYMIEEELGSRQPRLMLCQTGVTRESPASFNSGNTWTVTQIPGT